MKLIQLTLKPAGADLRIGLWAAQRSFNPNPDILSSYKVDMANSVHTVVYVSSS